MLFRRRWSAFAVACALSTSAWAQDSVLRVVPHADLRTLDPHLATPLITKMHGAAVYETLLIWDSKLNVKPVMAESVTASPDSLAYTFKLRPGLRFHDGQAVTTKDVVASLKRWMARDAMARSLSDKIASMDLTDDSTFVMRLKEPYGFVEFTLGAVGALLPQVMREKEALTDPNTPVTEIVGSGPFRFVRDEWQPGNKVVYAKNKDYVPRTEAPDGLAGARVVKVDRVEWRIIPDHATAAAALAAGEVDYWDTVALDQLPVLEKARGVTIGKLVPLPYVGNIRMNQVMPPFDNVKARQAVAMLTDQREMMQAAVGDPKWWAACLSYFVCGSPNETLAGSEPYAKPDIEKAKQLLKESGYKGEPVIVLGTKELAPIGGMVEVLAQRMKDAGFNVDLQMMAWGALVSRINKYPPDPGGWNIFATYSTGGVMHHPLMNIFANTACDRKNAAGWPCDEEALKHRNAYLGSRSEAEKRRNLEAFHRRLWESAVYVNAGQFDAPFAWRSNLDGVTPVALPVFWNIAKK